MRPPETEEAILQLHRFLVEHHWKDSALTGPDPGVRFNARLGRFVKSYLPFVSWKDDLRYMQAQGYWILSNWRLSEETGDDAYESIAVKTTEFVSNVQRSDGAWDYPNPEWRGRVATVEGSFGALGLLETFEHTSEARLLQSALRWHSFLEEGIGFRAGGGVNYWEHSTGDGGGVPNNSALVLWLLARYATVTGDDSFLKRAPALVQWLNDVQSETGEIPYIVGQTGEVKKQHFWCYNYNSFEFLFLSRYYASTGDEAVVPVLNGLASYLSTGLSPSGACRYECNTDAPIVLYYTPALALALREATRLHLGNYTDEADKAASWLLDHQQPDGSFAYYSSQNYGVLQDRRTYPRYLAMTLLQLILGAAG